MNLSAFDLNLLKVLDALLRDGSTTRAAERVHLSQPAVSAALARLRLSLGDPLFVRQGQRLVATDFALSLAGPLRDVLDRLETLLGGPPEFDPETAQHSFLIAGSDFFSDLLMPELGARLRQSAPMVRIQLVELSANDYLATLTQKDPDLALMPEAALPEWAESRWLFSSHFVMIARRDNAELARTGLCPGAVVPLDLFCDLGHVLYSPEGRLSAMGDAALARLGRTRRVVMTVPTFSGVCRAVAQSDSVALLPHQLAQAPSVSQGLAIYHPPMPLAPAQIHMVWHRRATMAPPHRWLRGQIAGILGHLEAVPVIPR